MGERHWLVPRETNTRSGYMLKEQAKWEDGEMACTPKYKYIISIQTKRNKPVMMGSGLYL